MKKIFTLLSLMLAFTAVYATKPTVQVLDRVFNVDTIFHAKVGPGTTQTSLHLSGPGTLHVFYLTIDRTNPYVQFSTVCATDKVAGNETVSQMANRKTTEGRNYYAGVNGDFFHTSGYAANGKSMVGTPTNGCIVDGEIYKTSATVFQFTIDNAGMPFIGNMDFTASLAQIGDKKVHYKGVNVNGINNGITLYTPRYYGCTNQTAQAGSSNVVLASLVSGDKFGTGEPFRLKVESAPSTEGNINMPDGLFAIHGRGTTVENGMTASGFDFVGQLKQGDIVTFTPQIKLDGKDIVPMQVVSGNPHTVGNGETLDTEDTRGDAKDRHPRTGIGYGDNKNKIIMMVVDGRGVSQGVRTSELADLMRYAGATEAINLDGGGSSCLYTRALGVRNKPSDGKERADGNGIFAVCTAPEDNTIASIQFREWAMKFPKNGEFRPVIYGYNKYGILVDDNVQGFELSCPEELGFISNKNTFVGNGEGTHALTATYKGTSTSIPVTIVAAAAPQPRMASIVFDGIRDYSIETEAPMLDKMMPVSPLAYTWTSSDEQVLKIGENTGKLVAVSDGEATVEGTLDGNKVTVNVKVQQPTAREMAIEENFDPATWSKSGSGVANLTIAPLQNGMKIDYDGKSARTFRITMSKTLTLWSLPDAVQLKINPGEAKIKSIAISLKKTDGSTITDNKEVNLTPNQINTVEYKMSDHFDTADLINYPVELRNLVIYLEKPEDAKHYTIEIPNFETVYNAFSSVGDINANTHNTDIKAFPNPVKPGESVTVTGIADGKARVKIINTAGAFVAGEIVEVAGNTCTVRTQNLTPGIYIMTIECNNEFKSTSLVVK